jgi:hypothetical protein
VANPGVPQGGKYPSRQEIDALLGPLLSGDLTDLRVDRRKLYGKQAGRIFNDVLNENDIANGYTESGKFYNPNSYDISQTATDEEIEAAQGNAPAFIEWDIPTSSTNYSRPRTVAAGYDPDRQTMSVVFRDGTFYNYYNVTAGEWQSFHASYSKGKPWLNRKNSHQAADGLFISKPRGNAGDLEGVDPRIREALYRVARTQQQKVKPKAGRSSQKPGYRKPSGEMVPITNRVGRSPGSYKRSSTVQGRNPATANRQRKIS